MKSKGFFGTIILLISIQILITLNEQTLIEPQKYSDIELEIAQIEKTNFERTLLENHFDKTILNSIQSATAIHTDAEKIKPIINSFIFNEFEKINSQEKGICTNFGKKTQISHQISIEKLNEITKIISIKIANFTKTDFIITGGIEKKYFPCAKITTNNYSAYFELPTGYTQSTIKVIP